MRVFALEDFASLAVLSSSVHSTWVIRYTSTMRTDIRYSPSDVFLTLPRPEPTRGTCGAGQGTGRPAGADAGTVLGADDAYNHVHDPD